LTVLGLYAAHFLSSFVVLFLTVDAISSEIDSGTLHAALARPIRRADVIVGRWLAYGGLIPILVGEALEGRSRHKNLFGAEVVNSRQLI
jgi:ABC-type transport system involved in multi-copper enzyme maturation permease subunit